MLHVSIRLTATSKGGMDDTSTRLAPALHSLYNTESGFVGATLRLPLASLNQRRTLLRRATSAILLQQQLLMHLESDGPIPISDPLPDSSAAVCYSGRVLLHVDDLSSSAATTLADRHTLAAVDCG